jgi:hypothetical protein
MICSSIFWTCYAFYINRDSSFQLQHLQVSAEGEPIPVTFTENKDFYNTSYQALVDKGSVSVLGKASGLSELSKTLFISAN